MLIFGATARLHSNSRGFIDSEALVGTLPFFFDFFLY